MNFVILVLLACFALHVSSLDMINDVYSLYCRYGLYISISASPTFLFITVSQTQKVSVIQCLNYLTIINYRKSMIFFIVESM